MKRILIFFALVCALSVPVFAGPVEISAESAILYCSNTGETVFEKNADAKMLIASTTKIMTAIVVLKNCELDQSVEIKPEWCAVEGSSMYLQPGREYTVRELLTGMLITSGNDAATALACHTAGSEKEFAVLMNEKASLLGMVNSSFSNPHGLDAEDHYSTARDMAILTDYCMQNEEFRSIVGMRSAEIGGVTYYNHNKLLQQYEGCCGVKTGYTVAAGRTLVSCAERGGLQFICVTLNAPEDWVDHTALLDMGFTEYKMSTLRSDAFTVSLPVISAAKDSILAGLENDIEVVCKAGDSVTMELDAPKVLFAGGLKGEKVGELRVFVNGILAAEENLVYTDHVKIDLSQKNKASENIKRLIDHRIKPYYIKT